MQSSARDRWRSPRAPRRARTRRPGSGWMACRKAWPARCWWCAPRAARRARRGWPSRRGARRRSPPAAAAPGRRALDARVRRGVQHHQLRAPRHGHEGQCAQPGAHALGAVVAEQLSRRRASSGITWPPPGRRRARARGCRADSGPCPGGAPPGRAPPRAPPWSRRGKSCPGSRASRPGSSGPWTRSPVMTAWRRPARAHRSLEEGRDALEVRHVALQIGGHQQLALIGQGHHTTHALRMPERGAPKQAIRRGRTSAGAPGPGRGLPGAALRGCGTPKRFPGPRLDRCQDRA